MKPIDWYLAPAALFLFILPLNHTMALRLLCLFLAAAVALRHFCKAGAPPLPIKLPLALWAGYAVLSLAWSLDLAFSANEIKSEIGYGMLAFFSFYVLTQGEREWKLWLYALAGGMLTTALLAAGKVPDYELDWQQGPVSYSTYLALLFPSLLALWLGAPLRAFPRNWVWLLLPVFLFAGYASLNRMLWLSLSAVLLLFTVLWRRSDGQPRRINLLAASAVVALVVLLFVAVAKQRPADATAVSAANDSVSHHIAESFRNSERYRIWDFWLKRIAERPWSGVGFGRELPRHVYADLKPKEWTGLMFSHAHNLFLDYALQLGVGGLAVLLWLLGALLREFWRIRRAAAPNAMLVGLCGIALVVTLVSKNMTDDLFFRTGSLLFWALAGMALGYGKRLEQAR